MVVKAQSDAGASNGRAPAATNTMIFVGHARLPHSLAPRDSSPVVSVELETNISSGEILSVETMAVPGLGTRLLTSVLLGHNINESPTTLADEIRRRYICPSQKAVSTAVLNAFEAYHRFRQAGPE